jgi:hypothetical protein
MVYSEYILQKFSNTCQWHSVALRDTEFSWLEIGDSTLQLSISAKTVGILQAIQAYITVRNKFPSLFPTALLVKMSIRVVALAFVLCVLYYRSLCIQIFPSHLRDE